MKPSSSLERVLTGAREFARDRNSDAVLFLGQPTDPIPRALVQDSDLPPWARLLWCYFRQLSDTPARAGTMSGYETICRSMGIGSRGTVAAALHALRVTRWITLLPPQSTDRGGRPPNVYLLHNMPLTYEQAMDLDPEYASHIAEAVASPNKAIRSLAQRMLDGAMMSVTRSENDIDRITAWVLPSSAVERSWNGYQRSPVNAGEDGGHEPDHSRVPGEDRELDMHPEILGLSPASVKLMEIKIRQVEPEYRQAYLDELAVRCIEGRESGKVIENPVGYLSWQVNEHRRGEITLTGKGERLQELLDKKLVRQEKEKWSEHRRRLIDLGFELDGLNRLLEYGKSGGRKPDEDLLAQKKCLENKMSELREQINGAN
ncbi:MAG: hypothetical protein F4X92_00030 [Gammaproteobacteria bacterium]|nr:hypothetical protein [Gammaproteobacteria bacterium]